MNKNKFYRSILGTAAVMLAFSQPSYAIDNDLTLYLWGAGISGQATLGSQTVPQQPVEADFDDLLDKLDAGLQVHYEGVGDQWGLGFDFTYLKLSDTNDAGVTGEVKANLTEVFGLYRANRAVDVFAGVRFTGVDISLDVNDILLAESDRSLTDLFGGARARLPLSDTVLIVLRGDIGAGDSDLVWNAILGVDWHVSKSVALRGGYRWLDYEVDKDGQNIDKSLEMALTGPFLGIGFQF
jgi:opacity protein-like surface antigen